MGTLTTAAPGSEMGKELAEVKQTKLHAVCKLGSRVNGGSWDCTAEARCEISISRGNEVAPFFRTWSWAKAAHQRLTH